MENNKTEDIPVCPHCNSLMELQREEVSNDQNTRIYRRRIFHCNNDDVWISIETPKKEEQQITVFSGVLINDGRVLMNLRHEPELPEAHLRWEFPAGKCDFGETPQEALTREFLEETGVEISVGELIPFVQTNYWQYSWGTNQVLAFAFRCTFINEQERTVDHHVKDVKWVAIDEVSELPCLPGIKECLDIVKKSL